MFHILSSYKINCQPSRSQSPDIASYHPELTSLKDHCLGGHSDNPKGFGFPVYMYSLKNHWTKCRWCRDKSWHIMVACLEMISACNTFIGWAGLDVKVGSCKVESCFQKLVLTKSRAMEEELQKWIVMSWIRLARVTLLDRSRIAHAVLESLDSDYKHAHVAVIKQKFN